MTRIVFVLLILLVIAGSAVAQEPPPNPTTCIPRMEGGIGFTCGYVQYIGSIQGLIPLGASIEFDVTPNLGAPELPAHTSGTIFAYQFTYYPDGYPNESRRPVVYHVMSAGKSFGIAPNQPGLQVLSVPTVARQLAAFLVAVSIFGV